MYHKYQQNIEGNSSFRNVKMREKNVLSSLARIFIDFSQLVVFYHYTVV